MKNDNNLKETYELKLVDKKQKKSYKRLVWTVVLLCLTIAVIIALAIGINIAKNGEI